MRKRKTQRPLIVLIVLGLIALAAVGLSATANAATSVTVTSEPTSLSVVSRDPIAHTITVNRANDRFVVRVLGDTITPAGGCVFVSSDTVSCPAAGARDVGVVTGSGDDVIALGAIGVLGMINSGLGNDRVTGGNGDDYFFASDGTNHHYDGTDTYRGGAGNDIIYYGSRRSSITVDLDNVADDGAPGENDNVASDIETLIGSQYASNTLTGNAGPNTITAYGSANNVIHGLGGDDVLSAGGGVDLLVGGPGNDRLDAGGGNDRVEGGDGNDATFAAYSSVDGADVFDGGAGVDTASYAVHAEAVTVTLDGLANDGRPGEGDNDLNVENVIGSVYADTITGNDLANVLDGGPGGDTIDGLGGNDTLSGGDGGDYLYAGAGSDRLDGGASGDLLFGEAGNDLLEGGSDGDSLYGGDGNDTMNGGPGPVGTSYDGDTYYGGPGTDLTSYATRTTAVTADPDADFLTGRDDGAAGEQDYIHIDVENISGGIGNDVLTGSTARNGLFGLAGNDVLTTIDGIGNDTADAGAGAADTCRTDAADIKVGCER